MWYPSQEQLQQQSWYKYVQYTSPQQLQQQQIYSRTYVDDEISSAYVNYSNSENDSLNYCQSPNMKNHHGKKKTTVYRKKEKYSIVLLKMNSKTIKENYFICVKIFFLRFHVIHSESFFFK